MSRSKRKPAPEISFSETLDAAAMDRFPGVKVETEFCIINMASITRWTDAATGKNLTPAKARLVREFVAGFSEAWGTKP